MKGPVIKKLQQLSSIIFIGLLASCDITGITSDEDSQLTPIITIIGQNPYKTTIGMPYHDQGATAQNHDKSDISSDIETVSTVDTSIAGTYSIEYTVTNSDGYTVSATRTVEVYEAYQDIDLVADIQLLDTFVIYRINPSTVTGNVTIGPGVQVICNNSIFLSSGTLTIGAGARLNFCENCYIELAEDGKIMVNGTENAQVLFRNYEIDTYWGFYNGENMSGGIYINENAAEGSTIDYAIFERALTGVTSMAYNGVKISNSQFKDCLYYGIHYRADQSIALDIPNNGLNASTFSGCELGDILANASNIGLFNGDLVLDKGVCIPLSNTVATGIWPAYNYTVLNTIYIKNGKTTIMAGSTIKFHEDSYFMLSDNGAIHIAGTSAQKVILTTAKAGTYWGFDNGEEHSAGIRITESAADTSLIENTVFLWATAALQVYNSSAEANRCSSQNLKYGDEVYVNGESGTVKINGESHSASDNDILTLAF